MKSIWVPSQLDPVLICVSLELWRITANVIPWCLGADKKVHLNFYTGISIYAAKRQAMHLTIPETTQS